MSFNIDEVHLIIGFLSCHDLEISAYPKVANKFSYFIQEALWF